MRKRNGRDVRRRARPDALVSEKTDVVVVGSGNAGLCAALAALQGGADVLIVEKADEALAGGNSKYTLGAMRFAHEERDDLLPLLADATDPRLASADFGSYPVARFADDLLGFNEGRPLSPEQRALVDESLDVMNWLASSNVRFEPMYANQSFEKDGRRVFWGGLTLAAAGEGVGLVEAELAAVRAAGGRVRHSCGLVDFVWRDERVAGVVVESPDGARSEILADAVVLACGGFEADADKRVEHLGPEWAAARVRGTPHNSGMGLDLALAAGAEPYGLFSGCHATPFDFHGPDFGNLALPHLDRKHYRKVCYFLGIMVNADGLRFVDEGENFRNYTYAQFGKAVLEQPGHVAWQLFDAKVDRLLYHEYRVDDASVVVDDTLDGLLRRLDGVDSKAARRTVAAFNDAVDDSVAFDPTILDGRSTIGLELDKTNWAQALDTPPLKAFPVTGAITFTYGGLRVDADGTVLRPGGERIAGLHACGELVGGVFFGGYPGGSGLTSGAVFGRRAGTGAARARHAR